MIVPLDKDDPNIPILIRDGWTRQPDGSWLSADKTATFYRTDGDARRVMFHHPPAHNGLRFRVSEDDLDLTQH